MTDSNMNVRTRDPELPNPTVTGHAREPVRSGGSPQRDFDDDVVVRRVVRADRIRWSSIWAGLVVALGIYMFLQLALVATGIVGLATAESSDAFWSAAAALVAFLVGGLTAGATAMWDGADDGLLHGIAIAAERSWQRQEGDQIEATSVDAT